MVALKANEAEAYLTRSDPRRPVTLVFGPDLGLVRERTATLLAAAVDDVNDPFAVARLDGEALVADPARLVDEALTIPLFGGRRAVLVRAADKHITPAVELLLGTTLHDCRVIIEAGDLKRNAPLRALCEHAQNATALPCYADSERDLGRLIDGELRGISIAKDARATLLGLLGGDRAASRRELEKLALYAHGEAAITLEDVRAIVSDASSMTLDVLIDAAFAGRPADVEVHLAKARMDGATPGSIMFAAQRQAAQLHKAALAVEAGRSPKDVVERMVPPVHFSRKEAVEAALRRGSARAQLDLIAALASAAYDIRRSPALADMVVSRALMMVARPRSH